MFFLRNAFKNKKYFKRFAVAIAAVLFALVFFSIFAVFACKKGANDKKRENGLYEMTLELCENTLKGDFVYSEKANLSGDSEYFVFCLQPNYLSSGTEREKGSESESGDGAERAGENEQKSLMKITNAFGGSFSYLNGGAYIKTGAKTKNGLKSAHLSFELALPHGNDRLSVTETGINLANFYPYICDYDEKTGWAINEKTSVGDPFSYRVADYKIELTVKSTYTVAGAKPSSCDVRGEKTVYGYNLKNYTQAAFCLSENFEVISKKSGNRSINCYYVKNYGQDYGEKESADFYEKSLSLAADALCFFEKNYGAYPREDYSIAFVPFFCGGMEYPSLSFVSANQSVENSIKAIVHETAHQWFPLTVVNDEFSEGYFDEGLAEFMTYKYFCRKLPDYGAKMLDSAAKTVKNYTDNVCSDMRMNKRLCEFSGEYEYYAVVYARGLILFCECEKVSGEKKFAARLKNFYNENLFCRITAGDFADSLGKHEKKVFYSIVDSRAILCLPNK